MSIFNKLYDSKDSNQEKKIEVEDVDNNEQNSFKESLKKQVNNATNKVEMPICEGDGLGIQKTIEY